MTRIRIPVSQSPSPAHAFAKSSAADFPQHRDAGLFIRSDRIRSPERDQSRPSHHQLTGCTESIVRAFPRHRILRKSFWHMARGSAPSSVRPRIRQLGLYLSLEYSWMISRAARACFDRPRVASTHTCPLKCARVSPIIAALPSLHYPPPAFRVKSDAFPHSARNALTTLLKQSQP
jgi:hypothetical protein